MDKDLVCHVGCSTKYLRGFETTEDCDDDPIKCHKDMNECTNECINNDKNPLTDLCLKSCYVAKNDLNMAEYNQCNNLCINPDGKYDSTPYANAWGYLLPEMYYYNKSTPKEEIARKTANDMLNVKCLENCSRSYGSYNSISDDMKKCTNSCHAKYDNNTKIVMSSHTTCLDKCNNLNLDEKDRKKCINDCSESHHKVGVVNDSQKDCKKSKNMRLFIAFIAFCIIFMVFIWKIRESTIKEF